MIKENAPEDVKINLIGVKSDLEEKRQIPKE